MAKLLPVTSTRRTWAMLGRSMLKTPWQLALLLVLFVASSLVTLVMPGMIGSLVDRATTGTLTGFPWGTIAIIAVATLAEALLTRAWTFQGQKIGVRLNRDLGIDLVGSSLKLDAQTVEDAGSGDLITRLTDDIDSVRQVLAQGLPEFAHISIYMVVVSVSIFVVNPYIGLVTVPMFLLLFLMLSVLMPRIGRLVTERTEAASAFTVTATENIRGSSTVRELGVEDARAAALDARTEGIFDVATRLVKLRSVFWALDSLNSYMPLALSIIWGAICVQNGWATWGDAATASILLFSMRVNSEIFTFWLDRLREMTVTMGRVFGVIDLSQQQETRREQARGKLEQVAPAVGASEDTPALQLTDVVYGYDPARPVITSLNLTLGQEESLALVGRSGSGKTTLARLMAGSLTADSGAVRVMGQAVGSGLYPTAPLADGRPALLICTQEAHLFVGTLGDNMTVAAPHASEQEQLDALRAVGATWVDDLPDGLGALLGSGGVELTRDQVQQLSLARIVAANPHTVILDESTTQLDLADARESLAAVLAGRAVVIISHDARIASLADRVVLLEEGVLVAEGSPAEIFARA